MKTVFSFSKMVAHIYNAFVNIDEPISAETYITNYGYILQEDQYMGFTSSNLNIKRVFYILDYEESV